MYLDNEANITLSPSMLSSPASQRRSVNSSSPVGQPVPSCELVRSLIALLVSLRIQTTEANKSEFPSVSPERAFADYVVCSLILHFFCVNFIN